MLLDKILDLNSLDGLIELMRSNNQKIVFTNGCFDILHPGHIDYLQKARKLGDLLIVAVNTDESVSQLKGESRPVYPLQDRMSMLSALECVDFVISFAEETPLKLIERILPDVLVKGADYEKEAIVGYAEVVDNGGTVQTVDLLEGHSTSALIEKLKRL